MVCSSSTFFLSKLPQALPLVFCNAFECSRMSPLERAVERRRLSGLENRQKEACFVQCRCNAQA